MPVYNAGDFLVPAIESILHQTYRNFELIIVNDASTDESKAMLDRYARKYPKKITVLHLRKNLNRGGDSCANKALKLVKGDFIARMDADDIAHPKRLEKQLAYLLSHPAVDLVGSNAYVIDKGGKKNGKKTEPLSSRAIYNSYMTFHPLIHPTTMYRRIVNGKPFQYRLKYSANNDYYTFFSLLCEGAAYANLKDNLLYYRIHGKNDTFVNMKTKFMNTLKIRLEMCFKKGYKPSLKSIGVTTLQGIVIFLLPEIVITQLYLLTKGITKISFPSLRTLRRRVRLLRPEVVSAQA